MCLKASYANLLTSLNVRSVWEVSSLETNENSQQTFFSLIHWIEKKSSICTSVDLFLWKEIFLDETKNTLGFRITPDIYDVTFCKYN